MKLMKALSCVLASCFLVSVQANVPKYFTIKFNSNSQIFADQEVKGRVDDLDMIDFKGGFSPENAFGNCTLEALSGKYSWSPRYMGIYTWYENYHRVPMGIRIGTKKWNVQHDQVMGQFGDPVSYVHWFYYNDKEKCDLRQAGDADISIVSFYTDGSKNPWIRVEWHPEGDEIIVRNRAFKVMGTGKIHSRWK